MWFTRKRQLTYRHPKWSRCRCRQVQIKSVSIYEKGMWQRWQAFYSSDTLKKLGKVCIEGSFKQKGSFQWSWNCKNETIWISQKYLSSSFQHGLLATRENITLHELGKMRLSRQTLKCVNLLRSSAQMPKMQKAAESLGWGERINQNQPG